MSRSIARLVETDKLLDQLVARPRLVESILEEGLWHIEIWRRMRGRQYPRLLIDAFDIKNMVVDQGLNYRRDVSLLDGTKISAWYGFPISGTPTIVAGDTYASHAGWTEQTFYNEATREVWAGVASATAGEATNAASVMEFTISAGGGTAGGIALVGGGSDPTVKGNTAGGGTLFSVSAFGGGNRALLEDDLLRATYIIKGSRPA